ncbi:CRISPR-associated protein, Cas4 family, modulated with DUF324 [Desulfosarcina variabilis str. Montpellier]|uniref:type III-B CRISPR module RAMP protein Cmr4 n=1 Tax=Desulfosarcina variabilis TaxID=2300 RepID=UPI003AFA5DE4
MMNYQALHFLLMSVDPIHIGTGGYRLGRVDNSIVREPGTGIPKIPGSSIHGAARAYAARMYGDLEAAGKDHHNAAHGPANPVLYTFGTAAETEMEGEETGHKSKAFSGVVNVFDAQILFFPAHSLAGPVWVSTIKRLYKAGFEDSDIKIDEEIETGQYKSTLKQTGPINLGWLVLDHAGKVDINPCKNWKEEKRWLEIKNRIVLVNDKMFSHIVNSNLEVRTSVSIDPHRGAAEEGALFTYEAIPRATFFTMDVVIDNYRTDRFPDLETIESFAAWVKNKVPDQMKERMQANGWTEAVSIEAKGHTNSVGLNWHSPKDVFLAGLSHLQWLGVGGMGTRGFGRIAVVGNRCINEEKERNGTN